MNDHSGKGRGRSLCASLIGHVNYYNTGRGGWAETVHVAVTGGQLIG